MTKLIVGFIIAYIGYKLWYTDSMVLGFLGGFLFFGGISACGLGIASILEDSKK